MVCAVGVCMVESILTMPVVTTLFRNLFDNIFTIFYGCWTVFNGVGSVTHPPITIWSSVWKVDSVLNRTDLDPPWHTVPTSQCPPCVTLGSTAVPGSLVLYVYVYVCAVCSMCMCSQLVCRCMCVSTPWF